MDVDLSLDEIVKKTVSRRPGRGRGGRGRGGRGRGRGRGNGGRSTVNNTGNAGKRSTRNSNKTQSNSKNHTPALTAPGYEHIDGATLSEIAAADKMNKVLLAGPDSEVRKLGNSINFIFNESGDPPAILAAGQDAVNQAIKGIVNAKQKEMVSDDGTELTFIVQPTFDGGSQRVTFELTSVQDKDFFDGTDDLIVRPSSDPYKVAGAIAARLRNGERFSVLTKAADGVFRAIESIVMSRIYLHDDGIDVKFAPKLVEMNWDGIDSTGVQLAILGRGGKK